MFAGVIQYMCLDISQSLQENTCEDQACNFTKKGINHMFFPMTFGKLSCTGFLQRTQVLVFQHNVTRQKVANTFLNKKP